MFAEPITEYEMKMEIENLKINKSPGYDEISAKILKAVSTEISEPLAYIFNLTFTTGVIPNSLKIALVTPVFNANANFIFENYRPISVLTCFSKLLEKIMYKRIIKFVEKNNILSNHQYGFRQNRSTEHAIVELTDKIFQSN